jgi:hypothetical protein
MSKKTEQDIIAEAIRSHLQESCSDDDYQEGHCGTYALALHDATKGKAKLGMIRGNRYNREDGADDDVQIHSYVSHPTKKEHGFDSEGEFHIPSRGQQWEDGMRTYHSEYYDEPSHDGGQHYTRDEFVKALKQTGAPDPEAGKGKEAYERARKKIEQSGVLKHFK